MQAFPPTPVSLSPVSGINQVKERPSNMREAYEEFLIRQGKTRVFSGAFRKDFFEAVRLADFRKNDHWLVRGVRNREIPYLHRGSAIGYIEEGKDQKVVNLWKPGDTIITGSTLLPRPNPGARIVFLEDTVVMAINLEKIETLQQDHADARFLITELFARAVVQIDRQYMMMVHQPPEVRIGWMKQTYPGITELLNQNQKASYLGISVSTFKRLQNRSK